MITAHVNELGVVFRGHNPLDQPPAWWESILQENRLNKDELHGLQDDKVKAIQSNARFSAAMNAA